MSTYPTVLNPLDSELPEKVRSRVPARLWCKHVSKNYLVRPKWQELQVEEARISTVLWFGSSQKLSLLAQKNKFFFGGNESGKLAVWLYELLQGRVARVVVCDPRKITRSGNKNDRIDARELADLLRCDRLSPVFHGTRGLRSLRELARTYVVLTKEQTRIMNRIKALYRSYAIACAGQSCYGPKQRSTWLAKLPHMAMQERAKTYYELLDALRQLRQGVRQQLLTQGKKHAAYSKLKGIPQIGPVSTVLLIAFIQIPERFRGKRQLWAYCGFALETHSSGDHRWVNGKRERSKKAPLVKAPLVRDSTATIITF